MIPTKQISGRTLSGKPALFISVLVCFLIIGSQTQRWKSMAQKQIQLSLNARSLENMDRAVLLELPEQIKNVQINIGPNLTPIKPPRDDRTAVIAVEANVAVANSLRNDFQKKYTNRFFVINCAVSGYPLAGNIAQFRYYNHAGQSSSLSKAARKAAWSDTKRLSPDSEFGPGLVGFDIVPVISLDAVLSAISDNVSISLLKTDVQGHDFSVITSASRTQLHRIDTIITETYLGGSNYADVTNDLYKDWIPFMVANDYILLNSPKKTIGEHNAIWAKQNKNKIYPKI